MASGSGKIISIIHGLQNKATHFESGLARMTQRVAVLENILIQQFGEKIMSEGEYIVPLLNANWTILSHRQRRLGQLDEKKNVKEDVIMATNKVLTPDKMDRGGEEEISPSDQTNWTLLSHREPRQPKPSLKKDAFTKAKKEALPQKGSAKENEEVKVEIEESYFTNHDDLIVVNIESVDSVKEPENVEDDAKTGHFSDDVEDSDPGYDVSYEEEPEDGRKGRRPVLYNSLDNRTCGFCGKVFGYANNCRNHIRTMHSEYKFKCKFCEKPFRTEYLLNLHVKIHTDSKKHKFICEICSRGYPTNAALRFHSEIHTKEPKFTCELCNKKFKFNQALQRHIMIHKQLKPYGCPICKKKFYQSSKVQRHFRSMHKDAEVMTVEVDTEYIKSRPVVGYWRNRNEEGEIIRHPKKRKPRRPEPKRTTVCDMCGKTVQQKHLKNHMRTHNKPFKCDTCGKGFSTEIGLEKHQFQDHEDEARGHECQWKGCGARFKSHLDLNVHRNAHYPEPQFGCSECGKAYKFASSLRHHVQAHHSDTPRPFSCSECGKSFLSSNHLKRHTVGVHNKSVSEIPPNDPAPGKEYVETEVVETDPDTLLQETEMGITEEVIIS